MEEENKTKKCTKCGRELPITDFYWRDKAAGRRRSECKYCHCNYVKNVYRERREAVDDYKSILCCKKCGDTRFFVLDFHHLDPTQKDKTVSRMLSHNASWDAIEQEIDKCITLCANCHREFHFLEKQNNININQYLNGD